MKRIAITLLVITAVFFGGCMQQENQTNDEATKVLEINNALTEAEISTGRFTPEVMWKMGRVANSAVSPAGDRFAYTITYYNMEENRGVTSIYIQAFGSPEPMQLTDNLGNERNLQWNRDGSRLYFLSTRSGNGQIWSIRPDGSALTQNSFIDDGIDGFGVTCDESKVFYIRSVPVVKRNSAELYPDMDKSKAKIYDDLMARHWDHWSDGSH